jgi:uncharacterized protein involved in cysteine biosynthesis
MIEAAVKALNQMASRPFRTVLWKSVGLAVVFLVLVGIGLQRLLSVLLHSGTVWAEATIGTGSHAALDLVQLGLAIIASLGVIAGMIFLMPAVAALVASFFADEIAEHVERRYYPADLPGQPLPLPRALMEGLKTALLSVLVYLCAVPFLLFAGLGIVIFFIASAFLLSREYFELAAMRFHPPAEARAMRKRHQGTVFLAGILIAAFVSIPIVNLATPLFATALMVHIHKRLTESRRELIEPAR